MLFEIQFKTLQQKTFYFEVKESQIVEKYFPICRGYQSFARSREEIAIMELELISHHFHMGLKMFVV